MSQGPHSDAPPVGEQSARGALNYERVPSAIYAQSFATVRSEARLERFSAEMQAVAIRLIHSCGMVEIADRLAFSPDAALAGHDALQNGSPVL